MMSDPIVGAMSDPGKGRGVVTDSVFSDMGALISIRWVAEINPATAVSGHPAFQ